jgi:hypothetical protein
MRVSDSSSRPTFMPCVPTPTLTFSTPEHVYEINFIKDFLEFLRNQEYHDAVKEDSTKYQGLGCSQLSDTFWATSNGVVVVDRIMAQLGSRENEDRLAILCKDMNGMKFRAMARDGRSSIIGSDTWKRSTWRDKYGHLKRVGGVASYMKTAEIETMFVKASNAVYDVIGAVDKFKWNLAPRYALWMDHLIKAYNESMKSFLQSKAKELFDAHSSGSVTGYSAQEVKNLESMAKNGNPGNFDMWWSREFRLGIPLCNQTPPWRVFLMIVVTRGCSSYVAMRIELMPSHSLRELTAFISTKELQSLTSFSSCKMKLRQITANPNV